MYICTCIYMYTICICIHAYMYISYSVLARLSIYCRSTKSSKAMFHVNMPACVNVSAHICNS